MTSSACFPVTQGPVDPETGQPALVLNQITKVRLADGREVGIIDWTWRPQYSTVDTLSGWTDDELRAFQYSEGDPIARSSNMTIVENATLKHTNIASPAEMDATEEMLVYAICTEVYFLFEDNNNSVIDDSQAGQPIPLPNNIARLMERCIVELEISEKAYQQASLGWFPPGFGPMTAGSSDTRQYGQHSVASREAVDMFPVPTHIGGTEKFAVILHNPNGTAITYRTEAGAEDADAVHRLRFNLMGLHKRPTG